MMLCPLCGWDAHPVETCSLRDEWPLVNRIMCDFVHRKIEPRRLAPAEREDA